MKKFKLDIKNIGKKQNIKKMSCSELALMFKVSKDQGDKKEMNRIVKQYIKKRCDKK